MRLLLLTLLLAAVAWAQDVRQEIVLERASASEVMKLLQSQYRSVQFTPHPTMNGFYIFGSKKDVLAIKAEMPNLDRIAETPPANRRELIPIRYGDPYEVQVLLEELIPDVEYEVDSENNVLIVEGTPGAIDQIVELLNGF